VLFTIPFELVRLLQGAIRLFMTAVHLHVDTSACKLLLVYKQQYFTLGSVRVRQLTPFCFRIAVDQVVKTDKRCSTVTGKDQR
jgi:hypothetical protein